jgi:ATP-binding cassette, subfamily B, bacterial
MHHPDSPLRAKLDDVIGQAAFWPRAWCLVRIAAPRHTLAWLLLLLLQGMLPLAIVYLSKVLVDSLVATVGAGSSWGDLQPPLVLVALLAGLAFLGEAFQSAIDWLRAAQSELVEDHIKSLVHRQATAVDLALYDEPAYYDRLEQARSEAGSRPLALLENAGILVQNGVTLLAMMAVLVPYSHWLPLVLLASTIPALYVVARFDRRYHHWWQQTTADRRRAQYYDSLLTHSAVAAELRLFGLGGHFRTLYRLLRERLRAERLDQLRRQGLARLGAGAAGLSISGAAMAWIVWRALSGGVTLGDLALFYQAFQRGQGLMRSMLGSLGQIYTNTLFLGNLFAFLDLRPEITDPPSPTPMPSRLRLGITFRDVTFRYPGSERPFLQDFNFTIPANKVVAIVGPNGAGKSTLIKLLCRFYSPDSGRIELDGVDLRSISTEELRRRITVLFQLPVNYQATAAQNIGLGDLWAALDPGRIEAAARGAGAHEVIARLPHGYETHLGKMFADGTELSGGEWQRVAMARAFLRKAPLLVLDEPTSFMDSWAEAEWYGRFRALARDRTALIITHRFTVAMRADIIHVMDQGRIVESGPHQELLERGGLYARSWENQMEAAHPTTEAALVAVENVLAG